MCVFQEEVVEDKIGGGGEEERDSYSCIGF